VRAPSGAPTASGSALWSVGWRAPLFSARDEDFRAPTGRRKTVVRGGSEHPPVRRVLGRAAARQARARDPPDAVGPAPRGGRCGWPWFVGARGSETVRGATPSGWAGTTSEAPLGAACKSEGRPSIQSTLRAQTPARVVPEVLDALDAGFPATERPVRRGHGRRRWLRSTRRFHRCARWNTTRRRTSVDGSRAPPTGGAFTDSARVETSSVYGGLYGPTTSDGGGGDGGGGRPRTHADVGDAQVAGGDAPRLARRPSRDPSARVETSSVYGGLYGPTTRDDDGGGGGGGRPRTHADVGDAQVAGGDAPRGPRATPLGRGSLTSRSRPPPHLPRLWPPPRGASCGRGTSGCCGPTGGSCCRAAPRARRR